MNPTRQGGFPALANSPLAAMRSAAADVHRSCGYLCGQTLAQALEMAHLQGFLADADFLGTKFFMQINGLRNRDGDVTASACLNALSGAAVEFPARASRGFWRG